MQTKVRKNLSASNTISTNSQILQIQSLWIKARCHSFENIEIQNFSQGSQTAFSSLSPILVPGDYWLGVKITII